MRLADVLANTRLLAQDRVRQVAKVLSLHRAEQPAYAKVARRHQIIISCMYMGLVLLVLGLFWRLGSQLHTRSLPKGSVTVQVGHSQYLLGEPVTFTVRNDYNAPMYVTNHCPYEPLDVYRWESDKWVHVHDQIDPASCANKNSQIKVSAKSSMTGSFAPWKNLFTTSGKYRLVLHVNYYDTLPYTDFEIIAKPAVPAIPALIAPTPQTAQSNGGSAASRDDDESDVSSAPATTPAAPVPIPAPTTQSKTITISAGTIVAEYTSTTIYLKSVTPKSGTYETNRTQGSTIEVTFKSGDEAQIRLYLSGGQLKYHIED